MTPEMHEFIAQDFAQRSTRPSGRSRRSTSVYARANALICRFLSRCVGFQQGLKIRVSAVRFRPWPFKQHNKLGLAYSATKESLSRRISRSARFVADRVSPTFLSPAAMRNHLDAVADAARDLECAWHAHQAAEMDWTGDTELRRIFYARYVQAHEDLAQTIAVVDWEYARVLNSARRGAR